MKINYNKAEFLSSFGQLSQLPTSENQEFVFIGRSNVGKSSLINRLCNRKNLARTSSAPGKTATINFYSVDNCLFVDLPGYGYARVSADERKRWDSLINGYFKQDRNRKLCLQLIDARHMPTQDDLLMLDYLHKTAASYIVVLTKTDKMKSSECKEMIEQITQCCSRFCPMNILPVSSEKGTGIEELRAVIESFAE